MPFKNHETVLAFERKRNMRIKRKEYKNINKIKNKLKKRGVIPNGNKIRAIIKNQER